MAENILEKVAARARVRVYKPFPGSDDRNKLEGEPLQHGVDENGEPADFFEIRAHRADYINRAFSKYRVSEPFIPGVDDAAAAPVMPKEYFCDVPDCEKPGPYNSPAALASHKRTHK